MLFNGQVEDSTAGDYFFYPLASTEHGSQPSLTTRDRELVSVLEVRIEPGDLNPRPLTPQSVTLPTLPQGVIVPTALYGAEAWGMRSAERRKVNVLDMKCLRSFVGVSLMNRVRNEEVRRRAGIERELASRADQRVVR